MSKKKLIIVGACLLATVCCVAIICVIVKGIKGRREDIKLYVHRGYTQQAPDCSKPAWEWAKKLGYYGIEVDIYSTADNVFVVYHDEELDDLTNGTGPIVGKTWEDLQNIVYDAGANIDLYPDLHISRIEELFSFIKDNNMYVLLDVKDIFSYKELTRMIVDYGLEDRCTVCSPDTSALDDVRSISSVVRMRYWDAGDARSLIDTASKYEKCEFSYPKDEITEDIVEYAHNKGVEVGVYAWDIDPEPEGEYERLYKLGVDSATINTMMTPGQAGSK